DIPLIDFSLYETDQTKVAQLLLDACQTIGFFYVINHGIPAADVDHTFNLSKEFFDLPLDIKTSISIDESNRGYTGLYRQKLDPEHQLIGDYKEALNLGNFGNGEVPCALPDCFKKHKPDLKSFAEQCHGLAEKIMKAFAIGLEIPEEFGGSTFFTQRHKYDSKSGETFRLLKYPRRCVQNEEELIGAGRHTDYGTITLLFQKDVGGLQVAPRGNQDEHDHHHQEWIDAPLIKDAILVNIGDLLQLWTGGLFKSTMHRVTFCPDHRLLDRYSIAYFFQPEDDTLIERLPSSKVPGDADATDDDDVYKVDGKVLTSSQHLRRRLQAAY
ncbi:hypothetical protein BCR42DRAFT_286020, partial [Absidia repens]